MNKLSRGLLGALALCAVGVADQAVARPDSPVSIAVFHPDEAGNPAQTVQYRPYGVRRPIFRRHIHRRRFFHHRRFIRRRPPVLARPGLGYAPPLLPRY